MQVNENLWAHSERLGGASTAPGGSRVQGGLTITARLDPAVYHKGIKISDKEMKQLEADRIDRHHWHGE